MKKLVCFLFVVFCIQATVFAQTDLPSMRRDEKMETVTRNTMLWRGTSNITRGADGHVTIDGSTKAYGTYKELTITLTLYKQDNLGLWSSIWENTYVAYDTDMLYSPFIDLNVGTGTYMVIAAHTVSDGYHTEFGESETAPLTVFQ